MQHRTRRRRRVVAAAVGSSPRRRPRRRWMTRLQPASSSCPPLLPVWCHHHCRRRRRHSRCSLAAPSPLPPSSAPRLRVVVPSLPPRPEVAHCPTVGLFRSPRLPVASLSPLHRAEVRCPAAARSRSLPRVVWLLCLLPDYRFVVVALPSIPFQLREGRFDALPLAAGCWDCPPAARSPPLLPADALSLPLTAAPSGLLVAAGRLRQQP